MNHILLKWCTSERMNPIHFIWFLEDFKLLDFARKILGISVHVKTSHALTRIKSVRTKMEGQFLAES